MLLSLLATAVLVAPLGAAPTVTPDEGQIAWFEGTYEEALAKAAAEDRLLFIDFWTDWCVWCKRLDADVFSQESVALAMEDIVCLSLDAESLRGAPVAKQFNVMAFPTLLVLNSDGSIRDSIGGYMPPEEFIAEIERIEADVDTISVLREQVAAAPADIEVRYAFALKLKSVGDKAGYEEQLALIRELDPAGTSLTGRRLRLDKLSDRVDDQAAAGQYADLGPLLAFLEVETEQELLFEGYFLAWRVEEFNCRMSAVDVSAPESESVYLERQLAMARKTWEFTPEEVRMIVANQIAWTAWEARDKVSDEHKAFALELAQAAHESDVDETSLLDTLACCLFMNGDREGAIEKVERCLELDPDGETWVDRLEEFGELEAVVE